MRYPAVISAVFIAAAAAPALAAPSGLGVRAVEEDALVQRSFDDELYARDLIFGRADKPDKSHRHYGSLPVLHLPRPPPRGKSPSKDLGHPKPVPSAKASAPPKQREARDL
ncbi:uncharacterized protein B0H18DRAFT_1023980 [Fomitopsis serialis]|uniref:uncharacterized protein n=1 Tax=Fomitopsis serialis TaxID=139415 RepID=UPI002008703C|nr:uncharacterized protein B0H18DRAFT_1023980 [Neoantrodia serialis]KAH9920447.1 hypothetical protein B0H18DRAFT_1023980 [Neoantrodia serialis]